MPSAWAAFWQTVRRFQSDKVNPWLGFRNAVGVALPLVAGSAFGSISAGLAMSTGALNVSFRDSDAPYVQRARQMLVASVVAGFTVFSGTLCGQNNSIALALTTVWAFAAGMLVAVSQPAADLGVMSVVMLLVYSAVPLKLERAALAGLFALAGGLVETALSLAFWPLRRYVPERRALGNLYVGLSIAAASPPETAAQAPPATAQSVAAQSALATLDQDHSVESERFRLLLIQAERMRVSVLALSRLRARIGREQAEPSKGPAAAVPDGAVKSKTEAGVQASPKGTIEQSPAGTTEQRPEEAILARYFQICSRVLYGIGSSLIAGEPVSVDIGLLEELDVLAEGLRELDAARSPSVEPMAPAVESTVQAVEATAQAVEAMAPAVEAMLIDARFQMDALTGQVRSAIELATSATPAGISAFDQREAAKPWTLRFRGTLATLRANLSLESAAFRHAVRLAVCVLAGDALARGFELRRAYWLPMTIAIVLKPDFTATFSRGVLRLAGTFAGLVFATLLVHVLPPGNAPQIASVAVLMFVVRCYGGANYGILATSVTALVVFLIALSGVNAKEVIAARAVNTVIGGAIALFAYWLWPTWERTQISEIMARMLDGFRRYVQAVVKSYDSGDSEGLDSARVAGRLARTNVEASIERANAEPGASVEGVRSRNAMLASSHRLAHALLALEAGLPTARSSPPSEAFRKFAHDVELTLYYLASALRGSPIAADALPDLREDQRALVHSSGSEDQRYAFMSVETDRITNSLNTLREELMRSISSSR
jgi:uncharacterized membrane protein YccC